MLTKVLLFYFFQNWQLSSKNTEAVFVTFQLFNHWLLGDCWTELGKIKLTIFHNKLSETQIDNNVWLVFWKRTGYLEQGLMVTESTKLRRNYLKSLASKLDLLSLLPTDLLYLLWPNAIYCQDAPCAIIVRMNRLFRFPRLLAFFDQTENHTNFPNAFRITKVSNCMEILTLSNII